MTRRPAVLARRLALPLALLAALAVRPAHAQAGASQADASVVPPDAPDWRPMAEAVAAARADSSVLLVHAYASWCGWCVRTDREVYADDAVQAYLAERYAVTRLDVESAEPVEFFGETATMRELGQALGVQGTPATAFFAPDGTYITMLPGFSPPERFLQILRFIGEGAYERMSFEAFTAAEAAEG